MSHQRTLPLILDVDLPGLCAAAAPWLSQLAVTDQRITAAPDTRTIRYYQSTGLLDRPTHYDGRTARYGRRHLLQLLAIRALQSRGLSLAQVQAQLTGATESELMAVAGFSTANDVASRDRIDTGNGYVNGALNGSEPNNVAPFVPSLSAVELAPGLVVTIDSRIHSNPARLLKLLRQAIQGELT